MSNTLAPAPADSAAAAPDSGAPSADTPPVDPPADPAAAPATPPADPPVVDESGKTVPLSRFKEVIDERNATRDYAEYWRGQAMAGLKPAAPAPTAPTVKPPPTLDQFADGNGQYDAKKWSDAYAKWSDEQINLRTQAAVETTLRQHQQRQEQQATTTSWQQKCAEFRAKQPDFDVVTANPTLPIPQTVADVIVTLDNGPAVFHHLALNPAEAARIARLPERQQAVALGKIDAKVASAPAAPAAPRRQHSNAPPPPAAIRPGASTDVRLEDLPLNEFLERRLKSYGKR